MYEAEAQTSALGKAMTTPLPVVETNTPPYLPFARFQSFIGSLHGKPLPPRIDRTLMSRMSGSDQSQIRIALRFLGLTRGDDNLVTDEFRALVAAYAEPATPEWRASLGAVVGTAYESLVGGLDDAATQGQLDESFRTIGGLAGSSLTKAVRFYLAAVAEAGMTVSPHFKGSSPGAGAANGSTSKKPRKPRESASEQTTKEKDRTPSTVPEDMEEVSIPVPGKSVRVWFPKNLTPKEFEYTITTLKAWRSLKDDDA